jgi:hypothetical protein
MSKVEMPKKNYRKKKMDEKEFSLALKILASGKPEIYQLLENKPFLRKLKEKLETV